MLIQVEDPADNVVQSAPPPKLVHSDVKMAMGLRIQKLRTHIGLTQGDIAAELNLSIPAVSLWERGRTDPGIERLIVLADLLRTTPEYLAFGVTYTGQK